MKEGEGIGEGGEVGGQEERGEGGGGRVKFQSRERREAVRPPESRSLHALSLSASRPSSQNGRSGCGTWPWAQER